jgi:hypothetical protein
VPLPAQLFRGTRLYRPRLDHAKKYKPRAEVPDARLSKSPLSRDRTRGPQTRRLKVQSQLTKEHHDGREAEHDDP